jgi:hypothetical protein
MILKWNEILTSLGVITIISGLITWLIKQLAQRLIDGNLRAYESELSHKLEQYKSELNVSTQKATKLHDKRLDKIQEFYSLLVEFHIDLNQLILVKNITGKTDDEVKQMKIDDVKKMYESGYQLSMFYQKNKLYFNKLTCDSIDELLKTMRACQFDLSIQYQWLNLSIDLQMKSFEQAKEKLETIIPKLKGELEDNFRNILGVD